jgi:hypothetical protein
MIEQNCHVRVLSRNRAMARQVLGSGIEIIEGDLIEVKDLKSLVSDTTQFEVWQ